MKKILAILLGILTVASLAITASAEVPAAAYPASGKAIPDGSVCIKGELIGNETGWGGSETAGRAAAFDGDTATFFDPLGVGDGYTGVDCGKPYILTKIVICPRTDWTSRFYGASIQGSDSLEEDADWTDIWMSMDEATEATYIEILPDAFESDANGKAFRYYRYYNMLSHGDVAEVEFYGYPEDGVVEEAPAAEAETEAPAETEVPAAEETTAPAAEAETEAPAAEETTAPEETVETPAETTKEEAPQTFDAGIVAAAAAAVSAIGYALSKKRK